jgi:hypothetical protein
MSSWIPVIVAGLEAEKPACQHCIQDSGVPTQQPAVCIRSRGTRPALALRLPTQNEGKHMERMAVRAKYMTLDPNKNR